MTDFLFSKIGDPMNYDNKTKGSVVVTGVSTGIGKSIAEGLMQSGFRVFGSVRKPADASDLVSRYQDQFVPLIMDVCDASAVEAAVTTVSDYLGSESLFALINNAGISLSGPIVFQPLDEIRKTMEVNFFAVIRVTRAFLPLLGMTAEKVERPGRIINIGSVSGTMTAPFMSAYSASKHAVEALGQGFRRELIPYGIEVSTIEPGFVQSSLFEKSRQSMNDQDYSRTPYQEMWQQFNKSLPEQEKNAIPANKVNALVLRILKAEKPHPRYPMHPIWYVARYLPDRFFDRLIFRAMGLAGMIYRIRS